MGLEQGQAPIADEATWVARFVSMGGEEHEGRNVYQRMLSTKAQPIPRPPGVTHHIENSSPVFPQPPSILSPPLAGASSDAPRQIGATDMFGELPTQQPSTPRVAHAQEATRKRGRKPVEHVKTQQELDLFELSMEIEEKNAKDNNQLGFIATAMIYASLPHSDIGGAVFKRKNNDIALTILNDPDIGLPYGKIPRIITAFLCTEAKRKQDPVIDLGRSQAAFAKKLGLGTGGGERGGITALKEQAKRLFTSHITLTGTPKSQFHWRNLNITDSGMLLWNPHDLHEKAPWESQLTLSKPFFDECIAHSVPIDMRVLNKLRSPLAIDIYIWMTYRYNSISHPTPISWRQLKWQLGSNYADDEQGLKNFVTNFKTQLRNVVSVYREAKFSMDQHKLTLLPSKPHILT